MLAQLPGTIKKLQFLLMSWLAGTFPTVHLTNALGSYSRDITAGATAAKADIVSNYFSKSLILSKQPKRIISLAKMVKDGHLLKDKAHKCNTVSSNHPTKFGTFIPSSATYFTEVTAHVSLKVAPREAPRGKTPENSTFLRLYFYYGKRLQYFSQTWNCLFPIQIFRKWFHTFHWI